MNAFFLLSLMFNLRSVLQVYAFVKAAYSVTMNIFRKKNIFFLNHLQK